MSRLANRLMLIADQVALAEQWLARGDREQAAGTLAAVHEQLVALAEELDR